jgi:hypothetical protein
MKPRQISLPKVVVPAEPPYGSVVLDEDGFAWQRQHDFWSMCGGTSQSSWEALLTGGTVTLVYEADEPGALMYTPRRRLREGERG